MDFKIANCVENETTTLSKSRDLTSDNFEMYPQERKQVQTDLFSIKIENNKIIQIPITIDGYVCITPISRECDKRFEDWSKNDDVKKMFENEPKNFMYKYKIKGSGFEGTYLFAKFAILYASYCSQQCGRELSIILIDILQKFIEIKDKETSILTNDLNETKSLLFTLEVKTKALENENESLQTYKSKYLTSLQRRTHYQLQEGNCVYLWSDRLCDDTMFKFGMTENINRRLAEQRTTCPSLKLECLIYCDCHKLIEDIIKEKYSSNRLWMNHEFVYNITVDRFIHFVTYILKAMGKKYTIADDIQKYNEDHPLPDFSEITEDVVSIKTFNTVLPTQNVIKEKEKTAYVETLKTDNINEDVNEHTTEDTVSCTSESKDRSSVSTIKEEDDIDVIEENTEEMRISYHTRKINQYTLDGKFIRSYDRVIDAENENNYKKLSIYNCCKGTQRQAYNFQWRYANEVNGIEDIKPIDMTQKRFKRRVLQFSRDNVHLKTFESVKDAATFIDVTGSNMSEAIKLQRPCRGYIWRYEQESENTQTHIEVDKTKKVHKNARRIVKLSLDDKVIDIYPSAELAAKSANIKSTQVIGCCQGRRRTTGGFKFKYEDDA